MSTLARCLSVAFSLALLPAFAFAKEDAVRNAAERAQDRRELRKDGAATADDRADRLEIEVLLDDFLLARKNADASALASLDGRVESYLASELGESTAEAGAAKRELRSARRESRSDRREIRENRREHVSVTERADDRHDLRDDRRDRRDDRRDVAAEESQHKRVSAVRDEWLHLPDDAADARALARKEALLEQLAAMARAEVGRDATEKVEDRRELREDRRETREDRRQG
jgi:hypothetical protein